MPLSKHNIANHFNRAHASYDAASMIQKECAQRFVRHLREQLPHLFPETILDVGSGTCHVIEVLYEDFPSSHYSINDIAPAMLDAVRAKYPNHRNLSFLPGDMDTMRFDPHNLITSNFALQWSSSLYATLTKLYGASDVLAFSALLEGTFSAWQDLIKEPLMLHYPNQPALEIFLKSLHPEQIFMETHAYDVVFPSATDAMRYIKQLGAGGGGPMLPISKIKELLTLPPQPIHMNYNVLFCIIRRI